MREFDSWVRATGAVFTINLDEEDLKWVLQNNKQSADQIGANVDVLIAAIRDPRLSAQQLRDLALRMEARIGAEEVAS